MIQISDNKYIYFLTRIQQFSLLSLKPTTKKQENKVLDLNETFKN